MQVVGKRHYGRKAVPHGGGGGRDRARELFDTLLLWQRRVTLDADGRARVEVPLNDSLTSFRHRRGRERRRRVTSAPGSATSRRRRT